MNHNFIDYIKVFLTSGNGGAGSAYLHRDRLTTKGGPAGGDGGRGGNIILKGSSQLWTLLSYRYKKHIKAENGADGGKSRSQGADGKDVYLKVPLGTVIKSDSGDICTEITQDKEEHTLLEGGKGGRGNWHFKSATRQTPRYAQRGKPGCEGWYTFELKTLADVGLVGFPNAGKSTLLASISAAKPKIANYPFTTLTPNLGIIPYRDELSFSMADIPGIISGAHKGKGLGLRFLRHIERNASLLFVISCEDEKPRKSYDDLLYELEKYSPELLTKRRIIAITKVDILGMDESKIRKISGLFPKELDKIFISATARYNLNPLKDILWKNINR